MTLPIEIGGYFAYVAAFSPLAIYRVGDVGAGEFTFTGTGFFCKVSHPQNSSYRRLYLVSCKHVLDPLRGGKAMVRLFDRSEDGKILAKMKSVVFPVDVYNEEGVIYNEHPESIDLACIDLTAILHWQKVPATFGLDYDNFQFDRSVLFVSGDVEFYGYPWGLRDKKNHTAVGGFGKIASDPRLDWEGERSILIQAPIYGGSSGSPVFVENGNKVKFVGVLKGGISPSVEPPIQGLYRGPYGVVITGDCVWEMIDSAVSRVMAILGERGAVPPPRKE